MELEKATELATILMKRLSPACDRIEIVGSVKRADKISVHDVEILLIPKNQAPRAEFGKPKQVYKTMLDKLLADLEYEEELRQASDKKDGERYKKRAIRNTGELDEFCLDLFIVTPVTWGLQNVIRTGPALFSHRFVCNRRARLFDKSTGREWMGFLPDELEYIRAKDSPDKLSHIKKGDEFLSIPEEQDAIALLGHGWIPPNERGKWALR